MTVTYTARVANARFGGFYKLLSLWRGSIYKLLYKEFLVFSVSYLGLSLTYRFVLKEDQKRIFEKVVIYCNKYANLIPISFVLGFYVTLVVNRWWSQYTSMPKPDRLMCAISGNVHGVDEKGRLYRRTLMRYCSLSAVLILRSVSIAVFKRFPTMDHVVEAGFMTREERKKFENLNTSYNRYWVPCIWFTNLAAQARKEGRIRDNCAFKLLMEELNHFRGNCSMLYHYDWISVPLVYTQVSMMAVDEMYGDLPLLEKDRYWDASNPRAPYTAATVFLLQQPSFQGSTFDVRLAKEDMQFQPLEEIAEDLEQSHHVPAHLFNRLLSTAPTSGGFGRRLSLLKRKNSCVSEPSTTYSCLCQDMQTIDCTCTPHGNQQMRSNSIPFIPEGAGDSGHDTSSPGKEAHSLLPESHIVELGELPQSASVQENVTAAPQDPEPLVDTSVNTNVLSWPLLEHDSSDTSFPHNPKDVPSKGVSYPPWLQSPIEEENMV
ncbi:PREDICTED: bestrophin-2 [Thamnophis sirtalis]|uniref:Bestrophin homolog n=1 Tax=Thamnophis sirtalis TaxID=35019 RepID=A0A6I9Y736_9SAUR|nr:PREDICTED: bestrophin-2 [Thamnophis sirtalis]